MAKVQSFLLWDCTTAANYKQWAQGIGSAMSALGWTQTTDQGQVNWSNVTSVTNGLPTAISSFNFQGVWAGGTAYTAGGSTSASVVTSSGLTYICTVNPQLVLTSALQNSTVTLGTVTGCASSSGGTSIYTVASGVVSSMIGQQFIVTSMASANNNGTFICTATSGTTSITLSNPSATLASAQTGSASSSSSVLSFLGSISQGGGNAFVGHSFVVAISGSGNSGTYTVASSSTTGFAVTATGTTISAAGTATENTAPATDTIHWLPYNYEVWQSNDSLSSTNPIYIRFLYLSGTISAGAPSLFVQIGSGTSGNGYLTGNVFNNGTEVNISGFGVSPQGSVKTFECDFSQYGGSFGMVLWRNLNSGFANSGVFIDRAKDSYGNELDTFEQVLTFGGNTPDAQVLFKPAAGSTTTLLTQWPGISYFQTSNGTSTAHNGNVASFPLVPIVGYLANPCLQAIYMSESDVSNGQLVNTVLYGAEHTYLMSYTDASIGGFGEAAVGLRWD
jgi:hypothetical protein